MIYIKHVIEAIDKIEKYLGDSSYGEFSKNDMLIDAVVRELEIIGEAANNFSEEFKNHYPNIPFRDITDMRNFLIHEYFGVNTKIVWETCQTNLPDLKKMLSEFI